MDASPGVDELAKLILTKSEGKVEVIHYYEPAPPPQDNGWNRLGLRTYSMQPEVFVCTVKKLDDGNLQITVAHVPDGTATVLVKSTEACATSHGRVAYAAIEIVSKALRIKFCPSEVAESPNFRFADQVRYPDLWAHQEGRAGTP